MKFFNKLKANKKITFFAVCAEDYSEQFLTITTSQEEAVEYIMKQLYHQNKTAFQSWCMINDMNYQSQAAWDMYYTTQLSTAEKTFYNLRVVHYTIADLAAVLRMFGGCLPIDCSFNKELEMNYFKELNDNSEEPLNGYIDMYARRE